MLDINQLRNRQPRSFCIVLRRSRGRERHRHCDDDPNRFIASPHSAPTVVKLRIEFQTRDRRASEGAPNPPEKKLQPQLRLAPLECESQTKPRHEWIDSKKRFQINTVSSRNGGDLSHIRLSVRHVEEVNSRYQVPPVVQHEITRKAQVEQVHAGQSRYASRLEDD